jgi:hypothetical protein
VAKKSHRPLRDLWLLDLTCFRKLVSVWVIETKKPQVGTPVAGGFSRKGENYQRAGVLEQRATASTWLVFIKLDCIVEYLLKVKIF